jgi:NADPH:quinone reductase-like Zn-dependent oxidoreductase
MKPSVIPGSDCAAKVILTGSPTSKFKPGDRVSPNFALDHLYGAPTEAIRATGLGAGVDGVLGEYRVFPEHVSMFYFHVISSLRSSKGEGGQ